MPTNLYGPNNNFQPQNSHVIPGMLLCFYDAKLAGSKKLFQFIKHTIAILAPNGRSKHQSGGFLKMDCVKSLQNDIIFNIKPTHSTVISFG